MKPVLAMQPVLKDALTGFIMQPSQDIDQWVEDTLEELFAAWQNTTRYAIVVVEPGAQYAYGPYASHKGAQGAVDKGYVGTKHGAKAAILPMIPATKTR